MNKPILVRLEENQLHRIKNMSVFTPTSMLTRIEEKLNIIIDTIVDLENKIDYLEHRVESLEKND